MQRSIPGSENNNEKTQKNVKRVTEENFIVFDVRETGRLCTAAVNIRWNSCHGEQDSDSSKIKHRINI